MNKVWLAVCVTTMIQGSAYGLPKRHSPFFPEEDYTLEMPICSTSRDVINQHPPEGTIEFWRGDSQKLTLIMTNLHYVAQVHHGTEPITDAIDVDVPVTMPFDVVKDAVCYDLNRDGEMDFVVTLWLHGNGLGAEFFNRLVILSSRDGYRFWVVPTMTPSAEDFVTFGKLEPIVMVTAAYENTGGHSYYAYDLWTFRDGAIISANQIDSRFPKWVLMTLAENHKPAISISKERRQQVSRRRRGPSEKLELLKDRTPTKPIAAVSKNESDDKKTTEAKTISTQETAAFFDGQIEITLLGTNYTGNPLRHKVYASILVPGKDAIKVEAADPGTTIRVPGFQVLIFSSGTFSAGFKVFYLADITKP